MSMLFIRKKGLWPGLLILGFFLILAGLFQAGGELSGSDTATTDKGSGDIATGHSGAIKGTQITGTGKTGSGDKSKIDNEENSGAFFVEYRLERDRTRSQQIDLLREIVNNGHSSEEIRKEAQTRLLGISQAIDTEMKLENLIRAEDFKEAVVFVEGKSVTIIVQSPILTQPDREKLTAIAAKVTGLNSENIAVYAKP